MFCVEEITDVVKIKAADLCTGKSTVAALHREIDSMYPNRVLTDVGLVIARYDGPTKVGPGVCKHSTTHFTVTFPLIVFSPFVSEIIVGHVVENSPEGLVVSTGFFGAIYVPAYWMLNPSVYENDMWVWVPAYGDDDDEEEENARYEMNVGAEIRVRIKSIHYTTVTATAKGMQAVTVVKQKQTGPERRRSSSVGLDDTARPPSAMHIVASICEDGLGLTAWWKEEDEDEEAAE